MRNEKVIARERTKLRRLMFGRKPLTDWRTGYEQGALQALTWVLKMTDGEPRIGIESKLIGRGSRRRRS